MRDPGKAQRFLSRIHYAGLDPSDPEYARLPKVIEETGRGVANFLSIAPSLFKAKIAGLAAAGLGGAQVRLGLEKPLGTDLAFSQEINRRLLLAMEHVWSVFASVAAGSYGDTP